VGGEHVALLAALVFALTRVTVAINRDTNPDTLMVLLPVVAAYGLTRSVQRCIQPGTATRWLLLSAMFLGLAFITKMLQAWIVVPVFAMAYLAGSPAPVCRRLLDLLGAGAVLLASSMWWVALVSWWPAPKPYIGGSTDGSVLNLVIGYNGVTHGSVATVGSAAGRASPPPCGRRPPHSRPAVARWPRPAPPVPHSVADPFRQASTRRGSTRPGVRCRRDSVARCG
jgi:4-amino-4-deoxy-L-arabinose transferase-like glycosyltransferase